MRSRRPPSTHPSPLLLMHRLSSVAAAGFSAALLCAPSLVAQNPVSVGENVRISTELPTQPHYEYLADASPTNPLQLVACSLLSRKVGLTVRDTLPGSASVVYTSADGGKSWKKTLELPGVGDPECKFSRGDTAFFVGLGTGGGKSGMLVYRSVDAGMTWQLSVTLPFIDREYLTVDRTGGKYDGRIYINGTGGTPKITQEPGGSVSNVTLYNSRDGGVTFYGPAARETSANQHVLGMGNSVVLSDGSVVSVFGLLRHYGQGGVEENTPRHPNATLHVARSTNGGERYDSVGQVSEFYMAWPPDWTAVIPSITADTHGGAFKDRLYVVWPDARSGRCDILFAYSTDKGKSWSQPHVVNDDQPPAEPTLDDSHLLPVIAVNKDGVVGVAWYDRRGRTDLGWTIRFAASLDGGETFTPSVPVSNVANAYDGHETWPMESFAEASGGGRDSIFSLHTGVDAFFWYSSGHTSGIAVDANGVFHPVWGDNRTGVSQLWTAPVTVRGRAIPYGSEELARYANLAGRVKMVMTDRHGDHKSSAVHFRMRLVNTTKADTIFGPVKLRIVRLHSDLGDATLEGAEGDAQGTGAMLDLSQMLRGGRLGPGDSSAPREMTVKLRNPRSFKQGKELHMGLFDLQAHLLARQVLGPPKPEPKADSTKK